MMACVTVVDTGSGDCNTEVLEKRALSWRSILREGSWGHPKAATSGSLGWSVGPVQSSRGAVHFLRSPFRRSG